MSQLTRLLRFVRHWHARIGVLAALFLLVLATTGIMLNHTGQFRLDRVQVRLPWLLQWYGLHAMAPQQGFLTSGGYAASDDWRCIMNGAEIPGCKGPLVGMAKVGDTFYLATAEALYILDADGRLVEKLPASALPALPIRQVGSLRGSLAIATAGGVFRSADGITWEADAGTPSSWSKPQPLPPDTRERLRALFAPRLLLEQVILDIHSGRILGRHGPLVMDLVAVVSMALSISGIWIYLRSVRKVRRHDSRD